MGAAVAGLSHAGQLEVALRSAKNTYVLGEPVKFVVTLRNVGAEPLRIAGASLLNDLNSMDHFFLEVDYPNGKTEPRRTQVMIVSRTLNPSYIGEPLFPGESVSIALYPTLTHRVNPTNNQIIEGTFDQTFHMPGAYRVRAAYFVHDQYLKLWRPPSGGQRSEPITIDVRSPTKTEEQILATLWAKGNSPLEVGDVVIAFRFDEAALRGVIDRFPDEPMTDLARFYLGKSLSSGRAGNETPYHEEAVRILGQLSKQPDGPRYEETRMLLAHSYYYLGQHEKAHIVLEEVLNNRPYLADSYEYVKLRGSGQEIAEWKNSRMNRKEPHTTEEP